MVWYQNAIGIRHESGKKDDAANSEEFSIFNHLFSSVVFQWSYECCYDYRFETRHFFIVKTGAELKEIKENRSLDPAFGPFSNLKCKSCKTRVAYKNILLGCYE